MDLRSQASFMAALLSGALAFSVLLRPQKPKLHVAFGFFAGTVSLWYVSAFARGISTGPIWWRVNFACGVLVPLAAMQFFRLYADETGRRVAVLNRVAVGAAALVVALISTPALPLALVGAATFVYVLVFFGTSLILLLRRVRRTNSRFERARLLYLTLVGGLGGVFTLLDYAPYVGLEIPPVGTILILLFLYMLSQAITRHRLMDLYELISRLGVLTALAFMIAGMIKAMSALTGEQHFLHFLVTALAALLVLDPVRVKISDWINRALFRDRFNLEGEITKLRRRVANTLDPSELSRVLLSGLEESRRVTDAALYLADADRHGFQLLGYIGAEPPSRLEMAPAGPLLDRLSKEKTVVLGRVERELRELRRQGEDREAETLYEVVRTLEALHTSLCLPIASENDVLYGLLTVNDDRVRDPYAREEVQVFLGLATQAAITVESSSAIQDMKERERLAALGEMAAGLAHEIRNPLGAIKAAAQYLEEPGDEGDAGEFLEIIIEETNRLDRVVSSFLDFARPSRGHVVAADLARAVQRTMHLLRSEFETSGSTFTLRIEPDLPPVRIDVELFRQVLINLVKNAIQSMPGGGKVSLALRSVTRSAKGGGTRRWVLLEVRDRGLGIPDEMRPRLFLPFATTKEGGTGLGLAISQRIIHAAGGRIEVASARGAGTSFVVHLPAAEDQSGKTSGREAGAGDTDSGSTASL